MYITCKFFGTTIITIHWTVFLVFRPPKQLPELPFWRRRPVEACQGLVLSRLPWAVSPSDQSRRSRDLSEVLTERVLDELAVGLSSNSST